MLDCYCFPKHKKMKISQQAYVLLVFCVFQSLGYSIQALSYDYFATTECLKEARKAQYGGGIIENPDFADGLKGWTVFGSAKLKEGKSEGGSKYVIAHTRKGSLDGVSQKVQFQQGKLYTFSAWIQINKGSENVTAVFKQSNGDLIRGAGRIIASEGCWSMIKGGLMPNFSGPADLLFECKNPEVEIWVENVSLQPFTMEEWKSHHTQSIDKNRKRKVKFQITDSKNATIKGAIVSMKQTKPSFPFGCAMNKFILENKDYQKWFVSRFKYTAFTNEMKWYSTEIEKGREDYTIADEMLNFCEQNDIQIRGHNIFWDDPQYQQKWIQNLSPDELREAAAKRIKSVVSRYIGKLIAWDVMNENLHFRYFEDKLGKNASAMYFSVANQLDPKTKLFMNEYNTIEEPRDEDASPVNYVKKMNEILSFGKNRRISAGIGAESHFSSEQPNLAYMRAALDILASTGLPIWLTEVDVKVGPNQAEYLEQVLREGYGHPRVQGIVMWVGPATVGFNVTTLADKDFKNTPSGDVVDKLINEWKSETTEIKADSDGFFEASLFYGDYQATVKDPSTNSVTNLNYKLKKTDKKDTVQLCIKP